jgi:hypothetical protein
MNSNHPPLVRSSVVPLCLALAALALTAPGCGQRSATGPVKLVPVTLKAEGSGVNSVSALKAANAALDAADTAPVEVAFTRALLVVRDVRFMTVPRHESENDSTDADDDADLDFDSVSSDSDLEDAEDEGGGPKIRFRGPFVVDLLTHHSTDLDTKLVPPGMYRRVHGHLRPLLESDPQATADLSFLIGSTVLLEGTISGEGGGPFTYKTRMNGSFQIRGEFTVEANTPATAFITFDLSRWLVDREGHFLDPRDPDNDHAIRSAIRHSIKVGMDDDHDGQMDDAMHSEDD